MKYNPENLEIISNAIVMNLTPDLLTKEYRKGNEHNRLRGHCYHGSACLQHFFGRKELKLYRALDYSNEYHWWCLDTAGKIIDLTADQYYQIGEEPPYQNGKKQSPLGFSYRDKVLTLVDRVEQTLKGNPLKNMMEGKK